MMVFFGNHHCIQCGCKLGFLPESLSTEALEDVGGGRWSRAKQEDSPQLYRNCENDTQHNICNWMIPDTDTNAFCLGCRLNDVIPDLSASGNIERWRKLESAKKRCLFTLMCVGLPTDGVPEENRPPLRFRFLADVPGIVSSPTSHQAGLITVNVAEADDDERERRRVQLHEPHRTLIGHLRHELGHYYWDRLVANSPDLPRFRELFGDETLDYQSSLQSYYRQGPAPHWPQRTVTAYASAHPWEDWAETWAHYLHIYDTLETATNYGLANGADTGVIAAQAQTMDGLLERWIPLARAINSVNRGMGLPDLYPFVIPDLAREKLGFIHGLILSRAGRRAIQEALPRQAEKEEAPLCSISA